MKKMTSRSWNQNTAMWGDVNNPASFNNDGKRWHYQMRFPPFVVVMSITDAKKRKKKFMDIHETLKRPCHTEKKSKRNTRVEMAKKILFLLPSSR